MVTIHVLPFLCFLAIFVVGVFIMFAGFMFQVDAGRSWGTTWVQLFGLAVIGLSILFLTPVLDWTR